jgi:hypothetical protein
MGEERRIHRKFSILASVKVCGSSEASDPLVQVAIAEIGYGE